MCASGTRERFRFVMVDEYQDTNRPQYLLIKQLVGDHGNLAVVGDPDQSIYKWRGADLRNILDFETDFPEAVIVRLEQNYRSTEVILKAASTVIANNQNRKHKTLWTDQKGGAKISHLPRLRRARRGRLHHEGGDGARSKKTSRAHRGALSHQRPVARGGGFAAGRPASRMSCWAASGSTSAGNQGRAGVLEAGPQPARRHGAAGASSTCRRAASARA